MSNSRIITIALIVIILLLLSGCSSSPLELNKPDLRMQIPVWCDEVVSVGAYRDNAAIITCKDSHGNIYSYQQNLYELSAGQRVVWKK